MEVVCGNYRKKVTCIGNVSDVTLPDDPSDSQISKALGGSGNEIKTHLLTVKDWEIHSVRTDMDELLIIGGAQLILAQTKARRSCNLQDGSKCA
tara:strand:- start:951 stop:1232 length:282 start_codon:yes stop_codon:yes gene_type:complete